MRSKNDMKEFIQNVLLYINNNYEVNAIIQPRYLYENNIYIATEKYDLNIGIGKVREGHYLFGECDYYISFDFEANKKYRSELNWHSGGYSDQYDENNFSNIDTFLNRWCKKREYMQTTIFDFIEEEKNDI